jgi:hypothetical protein
LTAVQRVKTPAFIMRIIGLPISSFIVLIIVPAIVVIYQFYYCWQVYTGRRD